MEQSQVFQVKFLVRLTEPNRITKRILLDIYRLLLLVEHSEYLFRLLLSTYLALDQDWKFLAPGSMEVAR